MTEQPCSKERELGIMATQITNIVTTINRLDKTVNKIDNKMDSVIERYATKDELKAVEQRLKEADIKQDKTRSVFMSYIIDHLPSFIIGLSLLVFAILQTRGLLK